MDEQLILLTVAFFVVATLYASVGFGGGSSYLALMSLFSVDFATMRPTALMCNIIVVAGGTLIFYRQGWLRLKKSLPFVVTGIPMAYLSGLYPISETTFFILLGVTLIAAACLLWFQQNLQQTKHRLSENVGVNGILGGGIGFLSGLVGIGGGIFLSPVLHLMNWDNAKAISATASFFILVNSLSGLAGQWPQVADIEWTHVVPLLVAVLAGGQLGSRLGALRFDPQLIRRITAVVIFVAGVNTLIRYL